MFFFSAYKTVIIILKKHISVASMESYVHLFNIQHSQQHSSNTELAWGSCYELLCFMLESSFILRLPWLLFYFYSGLRLMIKVFYDRIHYLIQYSGILS